MGRYRNLKNKRITFSINIDEDILKAIDDYCEKVGAYRSRVIGDILKNSEIILKNKILKIKTEIEKEQS